MAAKKATGGGKGGKSAGSRGAAGRGKGREGGMAMDSDGWNRVKRCAEYYLKVLRTFGMSPPETLLGERQRPDPGLCILQIRPNLGQERVIFERFRNYNNDGTFHVGETLWKCNSSDTLRPGRVEVHSIFRRVHHLSPAQNSRRAANYRGESSIRDNTPLCCSASLVFCRGKRGCDVCLFPTSC